MVGTLRFAHPTTSSRSPQRRIDQRAIAALGQCRRAIEAEPRQAFASAASGGCVIPCHSNPANCSGVRCASCSNCSAGINRCSTSVKSLPNGNDGNSPASRAGFRAAAIRSGKFSRCAARNLKILRQLAGILGVPRQFGLEAGIRDRQHRRDGFGVGFSSDVGDAIFGDEDVAQMPRNGLVAVVPADVGLRLCAGLPRRFQREDRSRALQREGLRHEIILAADAADDLAVLEAVGNRRAHQRRHHRVVDEARIDAGAALCSSSP